jgi:hypothetical protein
LCWRGDHRHALTKKNRVLKADSKVWQAFNYFSSPASPTAANNQKLRGGASSERRTYHPGHN